MRVLFLGSEVNRLSIAVLEALVSAPDVEVALFVSQPDRRGFVSTFTRAWKSHGFAAIWRGGWRLLRARIRSRLRSLGLPLRGATSLSELAQAKHLSVIPAAGINAPGTTDLIRSLAPEVIFVAAFDQILRQQVIEIPRLGCVNVHPSLLPAYRGPNPLYWVLHEGESKTGLTFHLIDEGIDTGDLLLQVELDIGEDETETTLLARSAATAARLAPDLLRRLRDGTITPRPQPSAGASYYPQPPRGASTL